MVSNSLLAGGQLGNKNSNMQSPPNVSVAKGGVDQLNMGGLPSSIASMQAVSNNGSSPQIMSSIQGWLCFSILFLKKNDFNCCRT